jgi:uncharacterized membrane protein YhaH (DUF805 family)
MDLNRLTLGEKIAGISAILLFVFMFFDWFGRKVSGVSGFSGEVTGGADSAWQALAVIPAFLMLAIVVALAVAVVRLTDADLEFSLSLNAVVAGLGALAVLLILFRIVFPPDLGSFGGVPIDVTRELGAFLGLLAAAGIAYGGYSAMRREGLTFADAADRLSDQAGRDPLGKGDDRHHRVDPDRGRE